MDLKELIHNANQLVHEESHNLQELLGKNAFPSHVDAIIQLIKENEALINTPTTEEYIGLKNALEKRREISLKATYAAISHLLLPEQFPLKSLDNFKSNLQSEKKPPQDPPMSESEELSQEDIEALLAGNLSDKKVKITPKDDDQISNDDIEALLAGVKAPSKPEKKENSAQKKIAPNLAETNNKKASNPAKKNNAEEEFSQEDIEALLAGDPIKKSSNAINAEDSNLTEDELNNLLSPANIGEESEQISEDDIKSLLEAQEEQNNVNPLAKALNTDEDTPVINIKSTRNTEKILNINKSPEPILPIEEMASELTNIPQNVILSEKSFEDLFIEKDNVIGNSSLKVENPMDIEKDEPKTFISSIDPNRLSKANESNENQMPAGDVKERILSDVFALYVNKNGKPVLHAECPTRDEIKKAYLQAMQIYPQNSLFIEKISRKEIIVIKETKEIINLKINISFD